MQRMLTCSYLQKAFGWCVPIGALGGLIGLGGGEFRLPVLLHSIGFDVRSAIPLNLMISHHEKVRKQAATAAARKAKAAGS